MLSQNEIGKLKNLTISSSAGSSQLEHKTLPEQPSRTFDLSNLEPIAAGNRQWVYQLPEFPGMIVKVYKIGDDAPPRRPIKVAIRWILPNTEWRTMTVEPVSIVLNNIMKPEVAAGVFPRFHGFINTSMGVGTLQEKLTAPDDTLAPTLWKLSLDSALTEHHKIRLNDLVRRMAEWTCRGLMPLL